MVERTKAEIIDRFEGTIAKVELELSDPINKDDTEKQQQWHIQMKPDDANVCKGETGHFHTWVRVSPKATNEKVPEDSALDKYLTCVEKAASETKTMKTVADVMKFIEGKKFEFVLDKLGKSYQGKESKDVFVPFRLLN